jgi:hypothetical protein
MPEAVHEAPVLALDHEAGADEQRLRESSLHERRGQAVARGIAESKRIARGLREAAGGNLFPHPRAAI